jgi:glycosyltransferase involved in cell wall biosynthesis
MGECERVGIEPHRVFHVPYGLDHRVFVPGPDVNDRPPVVSTLISWAKRSHLAVEVLERARARVPHLQALGFGPGDRPAWLPDWVQFVGDPDHPTLAAEIYGRSQAHLCTSAYEGFGLVSLEAMACGAPLVTTDTSGCRDFVDHDETGLMCEPGDVDALVEHLVAVLEDPGLRRRLSVAGAARSREFDWERSTVRLESMLERYVADPAPYRRMGG